MKITTVSAAEGKKGFSRLLKNALEKRQETIVTRRGKPVAVIVPYEQYLNVRRLEGYHKIMEARQVILKTRLKADEVFKESRKQLEKKT